MRNRSIEFLTRGFHHYLPGLVVGGYFLFLQFAQSIDLSFLILLAGASLLVLTQPELNFRRLLCGATAIAAFLFISTLLPSLLKGSDFVGRSMYVAHIPGILVFFIAVLFIREKSQIAPIAWSLLLGLILCAAQFFLTSYRSDFARSRELIFSAAHPLFLAPNDVLMFAIFLPLAVWYGGHKKNSWGYAFLILYSLILIMFAQLLLSRITLMTVLAAFVFPILLRKRWKLLLASMFAASSPILILGLYDAAFFSKVLVRDLDRIRLWIIAWHMFLESPWVGHGPGSFSALYDTYLNRLGLALAYGPDTRHMGWAHNLFLESAAEKGLLGLGAISIYFVYLLGAIIKKFGNAGERFYTALIITTLSLLLAACVEISLLRIWVIYTVYLLLGLTAALIHNRTSDAAS